MTSASQKWVYNFAKDQAEGNTALSELLGGKGANLAEMCNLGLPVPPGFTITTEVCTHYYNNANSYPDGLEQQLTAALATISETAGASFGDSKNPLLISVRSGARVSMPGMMDTVLNLGLNDDTAKALVEKTGDERFVYDSYRRFIQMYSQVVLGIDHALFEDVIASFKQNNDCELDTEIAAEGWRQIIEEYKRIIRQEQGRAFPHDVHEQLWQAIGAVFNSWQSARACTYRSLHNIPENWGTAVNIQAMVFGNRGKDSATGVAFTRDPATGEKRLSGEFLINAQGEDVVAGIRTPQAITEYARKLNGTEEPSFEVRMPDIFKQLVDMTSKLESYYRDLQDIEFTVEQGKLWMLQTRSGKRTMKAALKIAVDMVEESVISKQQAVMRIDPAALNQILHPAIDEQAECQIIAKGLAASPGAASGEIAFSSDEAEILAGNGRKCILVRTETSPEDIHGMHAAQGILTSRGGMTSHAAVVARGMGIPCVSGANMIRINAKAGTMEVGGRTFGRNDFITIDGTSGRVMAGNVPMRQPELSSDFGTLMQWADEHARMKVRANAETPTDAGVAKKFGAQGIGLCRTEHMFFGAKRIIMMQEMIMAEDKQSREAALAKLLPVQKQDFADLFRIMDGLPVTIRLLDPPLHEFLPHDEASLMQIADNLKITLDQIKFRLEALKETNPMLGHRGCRLGISYPEIYDMQTRAIFEAALEVAAETGTPVVPEIMIPLVSVKPELDYLKARIVKIAARIEQELGQTPDFLIGTMIELPRAALQAGALAQAAEFFSFGTNDLTQTTFGISRDDSAQFMESYTRQNIFTANPFVSIDCEGVGELIQLAVNRGREARPDIKLGICGEHGGDAASIEFFERVGLDYVSCSAYRIPIARLAAAQAAIRARALSENS